VREVLDQTTLQSLADYQDKDALEGYMFYI
ncbi:transcriptional regulator, partial [Staphylococcus pseudintermedius]